MPLIIPSRDHSELYGVSVYRLRGNAVRNSAGAAAVGHKVGVSGGGKAVWDQLESGGTEHSVSGQDCMGTRASCARRTGGQGAAAKALCRTVAGHSFMRSAVSVCRLFGGAWTRWDGNVSWRKQQYRSLVCSRPDGGGGECLQFSASGLQMNSSRALMTWNHQVNFVAFLSAVPVSTISRQTVPGRGGLLLHPLCRVSRNNREKAVKACGNQPISTGFFHRQGYTPAAGLAGFRHDPPYCDALQFFPTNQMAEVVHLLPPLP